MRIKTIVVGTDLGESGERALRLAIPTAQATKATLWLVHARDLRAESCKEALEVERTRCEAEGIICQTSCEEGQPWEAILRTAVSVNANLIAVGGRAAAGGQPERLLGSTAERVVLQAPCSVLVACGQLRESYAGARIAVGVDFSSHGIEAVRWARRVARAIDGDITLVHVVPHPTADSALREGWRSALEGLRSHARSRLEQLETSEGLKPSTNIRVLDGEVGKQLCDSAADINADLLFVGTRGQGRPKGMMLGSASQYCLRHSTVPVLTVRP